jgi:hypothetical protein
MTMSILLSLLLAQGPVLPEIDRRSLDIQARAERVQPRPARRRPAAAAQQTRQPAPRPAVRRASGGGALDLSAITTICRAAGSQPDPAQFLATLARAYSLSSDQSSSLRTSCAAYLAGRADAAGVSDVPAH